MRSSLYAVFFTILSLSRSEGDHIKYDAAAIERFHNELRNLGVNAPLSTQPDQPQETSAPTVTAPAGDFEGYWTQSQFGRPIAAFEGIPYAQPPVGQLRFKEPQPILTRLEDFKAKQPGEMCSQVGLGPPSADTKGQEDCLFLNVYVPVKVNRTESEKLPVMFFVHGGGFILGQGDEWKSNILLDKDVVLVTINYRLGLLGFLSTGDGVIPGNLGLKDQVAALRWVNKNIEAFGGNPNLVTVFGHSAGGGSSDFLMLSPLTRGLMHRVIVMSGFWGAGWALSPPEERHEKVQQAAALLNCPSAPSSDLLACLHTKDHATLTAINFAMPFCKIGVPIHFKAVVEGNIPGAFLPYHPTKILSDHLYNDIPHMAGLTSEEGSMFSAVAFNNETLLREFDENFKEVLTLSAFLQYPNQLKQETIDTIRRAYFSTQPLQKSQVLEAANLYTDIVFLWPLIKGLSLRQKTAQKPAYIYYLNHLGSHSLLEMFGIKEKYGVCHGDELFYLFPLSESSTPEDVRMSTLLTDLFTSFARDGVPKSSLLNTEWTPFTSENQVEYLHIKSPVDIQVKNGLLTERWTLLKKLFEEPAEQHDEL